MSYRRAIIAFACIQLASATALVSLANEPTPRGDATLRRAAGKSEIIITTTDRLAGAIHSLTWGGREFIDSADHGRQLQSAASFDYAQKQAYWAECFNPTEAGSRRDGAGETSTSKLLSLYIDHGELATRTQMAFWLAPGEKSSGRPALNDAPLSRHMVTKRVRIGYKNLPQVIDYRATFTVPDGERHRYAQFEALTGYMPVDFERFWKFVPATGKLEPLSDGPGEQQHPVVLSTASGAHAMGIISPDQPSLGFETAGYGRFRFAEERVVKWNCVFRVRDENGIAAGDYPFQMFVAVGTLDDVRTSLAEVATEFAMP